MVKGVINIKTVIHLTLIFVRRHQAGIEENVRMTMESIGGCFCIYPYLEVLVQVLSCFCLLVIERYEELTALSFLLRE